MDPSQKFFEKQVVVADHHRLRVTRSVNGEEEEITGTVPAGELFGDWRGGSDTLSPTFQEIERDVSEVIGFKVFISRSLDGIDIAKDGPIRIRFYRLEPSVVPAVAEPQPAESSIHEQRYLRAQQLNEDIYAAWNAHLLDKERSKESKEYHESRILLLQEFLREKDFQPELPFKESTNGHPDKPKTEEWEAVRIDTLPGLTDSLVSKLSDADIDTLGEWCKYKGSEKPQKISGVGPAAMTKLDDAVEAYFRDHPRTTGEVVQQVAEAVASPAGSAPIIKTAEELRAAADAAEKKPETAEAANPAESQPTEPVAEAAKEPAPKVRKGRKKA